ncbi:phosphotyrosine protein phosphatase [Pseudomonas sp. PB103]|jgi:predicted protein tyrosine phosphatase|uniref:low molecular weight protein tyrosine phosphatase family protein n=1 Tax=Pseudomonas sp. PB103 TaxID=2494698 RepID=UPI00131AD4AA|nr:low molecular weight protein tyrosine phosphatase family protein [Pseudomonas sp. PB103]KAE9639479.1 phosphotyrosine protein phosphatase [Pseudomonas sp. PB103]
MLKVLFVCSQNRLRSPTAEQRFADWPGVATASAGTDSDASVPVGPDLLQWADLICVMEPIHRKKLSAKFRPQLASKNIVCLHIPDEYEFMDPVLIELLEQSVIRYLPA